jgi:hypothetical protein
MGVLDELGLSTEIWPMPVEIEGAIPFDTDTSHVAYDGAQAHRFWLALVQMNRVFEVFRSRFVGKVSPVHFFWGALDLAVNRFSGRTAPNIPAERRTVGPRLCGRPTPTKSAARATGRAPTAKASSTPTPTLNHPGIGMHPSHRPRRRSTTVWVNSCCPTPPYAMTTPTRCCSTSCKASTTSPPTPAMGTAPRWNAVYPDRVPSPR